jgi:hypothetical protein
VTSSGLSVRYSGNLGEVNIAGHVRDLEEFVGVLVLGSGSLATSSEGDPSPYREFLSCIAVRSVLEGRIVLSVDEDEGVLKIAGSLKFLYILAENICELCRESVLGEHLHVDYFPEHFYLAESQVSLVIHLSDE